MRCSASTVNGHEGRIQILEHVDCPVLISCSSGKGIAVLGLKQQTQPRIGGTVTSEACPVR